MNVGGLARHGCGKRGIYTAVFTSNVRPPKQTHRCHVLSKSYSKFPHRTGLSSRLLLFLQFDSRETEADAGLAPGVMLLSSGEQLGRNTSGSVQASTYPSYLGTHFFDPPVVSEHFHHPFFLVEISAGLDYAHRLNVYLTVSGPLPTHQRRWCSSGESP